MTVISRSRGISNPTEIRREELVQSTETAHVFPVIERTARKTLSDLVTWHPAVIAADHPKARMVISALVPPMAIVFEGLDRLKKIGRWIWTYAGSSIK